MKLCFLAIRKSLLDFYFIIINVKGRQLFLHRQKHTRRFRVQNEILIVFEMVFLFYNNINLYGF